MSLFCVSFVCLCCCSVVCSVFCCFNVLFVCLCCSVVVQAADVCFVLLFSFCCFDVLCSVVLLLLLHLVCSLFSFVVYCCLFCFLLFFILLFVFVCFVFVFVCGLFAAVMANNFKTVLCRHAMNAGGCKLPHGQCGFAHSEAELEHYAELRRTILQREQELADLRRQIQPGLHLLEHLPVGAAATTMPKKATGAEDTYTPKPPSYPRYTPYAQSSHRPLFCFSLLFGVLFAFVFHLLIFVCCL